MGAPGGEHEDGGVPEQSRPEAAGSAVAAATPGGVPSGSEDSGAPVRGPAAALRIGLIALLTAAAGAFGLYEARFLPDSGARSAILRRRPPSQSSIAGDFQLLKGDVALAREPVAINGRDVVSLRCSSALPPRELVEEYARSLQAEGYEAVKDPRVADALGAGRFVRFHGQGQAMLGMKAPDGGFLGLIAFEDPESGGSDYFVVQEAAGRQDAESAEAGGKGPPGVDPPPSSLREFCVERKTHNPSYLVLYRSQADLERILSSYRTSMPAAGWAEPKGASEAFDGVPGGAHLLFRRGDEQCLISVSPSEEDDRECKVSVMYRRRAR